MKSVCLDTYRLYVARRPTFMLHCHNIRLFYSSVLRALHLEFRRDTCSFSRRRHDIWPWYGFMFDIRLTGTCLVADLRLCVCVMQSVGTQCPWHRRIVIVSQALFASASYTKLLLCAYTTTLYRLQGATNNVPTCEMRLSGNAWKFFRSETDPTSLLILLLLLLLLLGRRQKNPRFRRFKSDRDEIRQDCCSSKYASTNAFGFLTWRHTFKMATMTSVRRSLMQYAAAMSAAA